MPTRVVVDDDEQIIADLQKDMRRLRSRLATTSPHGGHDAWTAAATPATTYQLTTIPVQGTCEFAINGHEQREGTDYTVNYDTGLVTVSAALSSGDKLVARYLVTDWLVARSLPMETGTVIWGVRSNKATIVGAFDGVALINTGAAFADIGADLTPATGHEIDLVFGCVNYLSATGPPATTDGSYLFLRVYSAFPGIFRFDRISGVDGDTQLQAIPAATGTATYQVTRSGSVLTVIRNGTTLTTVTLTGSDATMLGNTIVGLRANVAGGGTADNFTASAGTVADSFTRVDADDLGQAPTGQTWVSTS